MIHAIVCELPSLLLLVKHYHHHLHHKLQLCLAAGERESSTVDKVLRLERVSESLSERRGLVQNAGCQAPCPVAQIEYDWDGAQRCAFCQTSQVILVQVGGPV